MPESENLSFSSTESVIRETAADRSWAGGKTVETHTQDIGLNESIRQEKLDPVILLDAMKTAQDAWDPPEKGGNLIKVVDYRDPNWKGDRALEVVLTIRQHTFNRELERAERRVEETKHAEEEGKTDHISSPRYSKTVIGSNPAHFEAQSGGVQMFLDGASRTRCEGGASQSLPDAALGIQFTDRGLFFVSLTDEAQMTVHYTDRRDKTEHDIPIDAGTGGMANETQMLEFNSHADPNSTYVEIRTQDGVTQRLAVSRVVEGRSIKDKIFGNPATIREIQWKLEHTGGKQSEPRVGTEEKKEDPKSQTRSGEVRIKSGIEGLTWSLASSSGDTADYDTDPANLIYEYTSEAPEIAGEKKGDNETEASKGRDRGYQRNPKERYLTDTPVPLTAGGMILVGSEPLTAATNCIVIEGLPKFQMALIMNADGTEINEVAARNSRPYQIQLRRLRDGKLIQEVFNPRDAKFSRSHQKVTGMETTSENIFATEVDPASLTYGVMNENGNDLEFEIRIVDIKPGAQSFRGGKLEVIDRRKT